MPITNKILREHMNPVFIETGTFMGAGVLAAVWAGFETVYSIELSDYLYERNMPIFKQFTNVHLIKGDSGEELANLLNGINETCTFWLDAHYSEQCTVNGPSPLFKELDAINKHHIKDHTILIDDISDYNITDVTPAISNYKHFTPLYSDNILICLP